jgi:hypothetical protein
MAREEALAHLPSQYGRASRLSSVACHRSSRKCAEMAQAREPNPVRGATLVAPVRIMSVFLSRARFRILNRDAGLPHWTIGDIVKVLEEWESHE